MLSVIIFTVSWGERARAGVAGSERWLPLRRAWWDKGTRGRCGRMILIRQRDEEAMEKEDRGIGLPGETTNLTI